MERKKEKRKKRAMMLKKNLKVACYIRVSTVEQKEMYWDELQLKRIKKIFIFLRIQLKSLLYN